MGSLLAVLASFLTLSTLVVEISERIENHRIGFLLFGKRGEVSLEKVDRLAPQSRAGNRLWPMHSSRRIAIPDSRLICRKRHKPPRCVPGILARAQDYRMARHRKDSD